MCNFPVRTIAAVNYSCHNLIVSGNMTVMFVEFFNAYTDTLIYY